MEIIKELSGLLTQLLSPFGWQVVRTDLVQNPYCDYEVRFKVEMRIHDLRHPICGRIIDYSIAFPLDRINSRNVHDLAMRFASEVLLGGLHKIGESIMTEPTPEGIRRYPPDGRYNANDEPGTPCTCLPTCPQACKGECGCEACREGYGDVLSSRDE